jgi:hypothetical protein
MSFWNPARAQMIADREGLDGFIASTVTNVVAPQDKVE